MARIRCKYLDCAFLDENYCSAAMIELDSDKGCLTYKPIEEMNLDQSLEEVGDLSEWEDDIEEPEGEDEDPWMDEEDEEDEEDDFN